jgi:uncharacterized protein YegL
MYTTEQGEGAGTSLYHAFLLLDGSGSMKEIEHETGQPKHLAAAHMVQALIDEMHDNYAITDTLLTVICYCGNNVQDIRVRDYDVKSNTYYKQTDVSQWDPLVGHGGTTPIGRALAYGREMAENWINAAPGIEVRRAVIFLVSDGMNYPETEPDGTDEKQKIREFNAQQEKLRQQGGFKGRIRLATIGYFQAPQGSNDDEDKGRELLRKLPDNPRAFFFESKKASEIANYILYTIEALKEF